MFVMNPLRKKKWQQGHIFSPINYCCKCYNKHFYKNVANPPPLPRKKKARHLYPHCPISLQWLFCTLSKVVVAGRFYCNSSWIYLVFTPSNIPVLMKNGQTTVVSTPVFFITPSSIIKDSSKPTAPNLDAQ